ncbi:unnamed protein product, partial [Owenia fusiformis]
TTCRDIKNLSLLHGIFRFHPTLTTYVPLFPKPPSTRIYQLSNLDRVCFFLTTLPCLMSRQPTVTQTEYIPAQQCVLQLDVNVAEPIHVAPPQDGAGLLQDLVFDFVPPPQATLHACHAPQSPQSPSTKMKWTPVFTCGLFYWVLTAFCHLLITCIVPAHNVADISSSRCLKSISLHTIILKKNIVKFIYEQTYTSTAMCVTSGR